jgi:hypothetical protein
LAYSVEKLLGEISLENTKPIERLEFERAEGLAPSDDISSQLIVVRQAACLFLVFSHKLIRVRNLQCGENEFFNRIGRKDSLAIGDGATGSDRPMLLKNS